MFPVRLRILILAGAGFLLLAGVTGRMIWLMVWQSAYYEEEAADVQQRERAIKAARGEIYDRRGTLLAGNRTVCTVSVVHNQVEEPEQVIDRLTEILEIDRDTVRKKVEKYSSREIIASNVDKEKGDEIRALHLAGVKVDEDYKRYYPYGTLASKILGFTGGDNQGILGLEVQYDALLQGTNGVILTPTDASGTELVQEAEQRIEPVAGNNLYLTLDADIQSFAQQTAESLYEEKSALHVSIIVMNPQNGEIYAMADVPEYDLNDPFTLFHEDGSAYSEEELAALTEKERSDLRNRMWRNFCINDTYEPGSTFKIITMAAGLSEGVVTPESTFFCPGYKIVEDRRIRCHKSGGHGSETFVQGAMNSCNPVFMEVGLRMGPAVFMKYIEQFQILQKTGVDLPGEASTIMHELENIGEVELATMSFGQSFQLTPLRHLTTICSLINGGKTIIPHLGAYSESADGSSVEYFTWESQGQVLESDISETVRTILEAVVAEGSGNKAYIEGYRVGGKTATSEKLPRGNGKYISSFVGFAPADDPQIAVLVLVNEPQGVYYGGTVCAPAAAAVLENILPFLEERY
ncbi:MAG: penicillin-binding transpeptidase domain-containing protein [Lachnospiraceae bacterium]|nr:penicillin-binding transpeptidase domain-containing protein [Lachnospiraceae bacterium]MDY4970920.1 penicillin-binding transpeptidase domain-containing protein [Lachnospiraceae bacterium]